MRTIQHVLCIGRPLLAFPRFDGAFLSLTQSSAHCPHVRTSDMFVLSPVVNDISVYVIGNYGCDFVPSYFLSQR